MAIETELKLALDPENIPQLLSHPLITGQGKAGQGEKSRQLKLRGTYFDTPGHDLHDRKMVLRVRREGIV